MKYSVLAFGLIFTACQTTPESSVAEVDVVPSENVESTPQTMSTFYDFTVPTLDGTEFDFSTLKGKRVLIVNTASECGYTPQYAQLQELYEMYGGDQFTIIGFPANDFGAQEPGSDAQIKTFCQANYGVTFPMMSKITVLGEQMHPVYRWLTSAELNGVGNGEVKWNFHKFLIDENGNWVTEYPSSVTPLDEQIVDFASGK